VSAARRRWSLVETDLGDPVGHEQGFRRPVLIVSNEAFNRASGLITVLPVTSVKPGRPLQPFEVFLPAGAAGNPVDSMDSATCARWKRSPDRGLPGAEPLPSALCGPQTGSTAISSSRASRPKSRRLAVTTVAPWRRAVSAIKASFWKSRRLLVSPPLASPIVRIRHVGVEDRPAHVTAP